MDTNNKYSALSDDPRLLRERIRLLEEQVARYKGYVGDLERELIRLLPRREAQAKAALLGRSGPTLFGDLGEAAREAEAAEEAAGEPIAPPRGPAGKEGKKRGRKALPKELPREDVYHYVDVNELPDYDAEKKHQRLDFELQEQLQYVPAWLKVLRHWRETIVYETRAGEVRIVTADGPEQVIARGLPTERTLAKVAADHFQRHLPLYRVAREFARLGYAVSRGTLSRWLWEVAGELQPIVTAMIAALRSGDYVGADDTQVRVLAPGTGKTEPHHVWAYVGGAEGKRQVVFTSTRQRTGAGPEQLLGDFEGWLQVDACSVYDALFLSGKIEEVGCWSHTLRKVEDVAVIDRRAEPLLRLIRRLYEVEQWGAGLTPPERKVLRALAARPVLTEIKRWVDAQYERELIPSGFKLALQYIRNQWAALERYLDDGRLRIDNNVVEGEFHVFGVGRRNWLFRGSAAHLERALVLFSLVRSCAANGIDPYAYLEDVLVRVRTHPGSRVWELTPAHWRELTAREAAEKEAAKAPPVPEACPAVP